MRTLILTQNNYKIQMKNLILLLALVLGVSTYSSAQTDGNKLTLSTEAAPKFTLEKTSHDFGNIEEGVQATVSFTFKNTGNAPLVLNSVKASCGCTTPKWTRNPVAPGEKGEIVVHYDTNRMGQFHKTITVQSNAKSSTKMLTIKGTVEPKETAPTTPVKQEGASKVSKK